MPSPNLAPIIYPPPPQSGSAKMASAPHRLGLKFGGELDERVDRSAAVGGGFLGSDDKNAITFLIDRRGGGTNGTFNTLFVGHETLSAIM